jgi:hypothetical protein
MMLAGNVESSEPYENTGFLENKEGTDFKGLTGV